MSNTMGVRVSHEYGDKTVKVFEKETLTNEARLAFTLLERWGMVAAMDDGEDSSGRHKLRLSTSQEVVDRAFEVVKLFMDSARRKGFTLKLPDLNEINASKDEKEKGRA